MQKSTEDTGKSSTLSIEFCSFYKCKLEKSLLELVERILNYDMI